MVQPQVIWLTGLSGSGKSTIASHLANQKLDEGFVVIAALISPFRADRDLARTALGSLFKEAYVSTPLSECERRDPKGLYKKTRDGLILDMTGIDSPYELPLQPEIIIDTSVLNIEESVEKILITL